MTRDQQKAEIKKKIKTLQEKIPAEKQKMIDDNFSIKSIRIYNRTLSAIQLLNERYDDVAKFNKPKKYMNEINLPLNTIY